MDRQGETAGERRTEDEWWHDLYEEGVPDTGPQRAGDTLDDRFASVARAVDEETDTAPRDPAPPEAAGPSRASAQEPYDQMQDPDYPPPPASSAPPPSVAGVPGFTEREESAGRGWADDVFAGLREDGRPAPRSPERDPEPEPAEPSGPAAGETDPWWDSVDHDPEPGDPAVSGTSPAAPGKTAERAPAEEALPDREESEAELRDAPAPADAPPPGTGETAEPAPADAVLPGPADALEPAPAEEVPSGPREPAEPAPPAPAPRASAAPEAAERGFGEAAPPAPGQRAPEAPEPPAPAPPPARQEPAPAAAEPGDGHAVPPGHGRQGPAQPAPGRSVPSAVSAPEPPPRPARPAAERPAPPTPAAAAESGPGHAAPSAAAQPAPPEPLPSVSAPPAPVPPAPPGRTGSAPPVSPDADEPPPATMRLRQVSATDTLTDADWARGGQDFVGGGPPAYEAEPTALPEVAPGALGDLVPDTVLDGARYGSFTLRAVATRGDSPRHRGEQRRDAILTARFGGGDDALVFVAVATGARGVPRTDRAAESLVRWMGEAVGRSRARLSEDIRTGRRAALKGGLHRLTGRTYGLMRAQAEEIGADPAGYTAGLRCLLLSTDPGCRTRVFFGTGPGGLFRLRGDEWQDLEPAPPEEEAAPAQPPADPRLTVDLGVQPQRPAPAGPPPPGFGALVDTPDPGEPAPFAFRASEGKPGDVLLLCSPGFAEPLRGAPGLAAELGERWRGEEAPPGLAAFLADVQLRAKGFADDRTAAALWES
ncbi:protein phosphatase 2C domain-containing protein [Streptomyces sp. B8F3]|uniref:protein phosphatase 2C domain-containing protein n=1 Tax=Streptomyces sp. B8F3 TaxID=3153573 RepID=UPI00325D8F26